MPDTNFRCLPTIIGSMPNTDPAEACALITRYLQDIPAWPQLPARSFYENMSVQYSEGCPGIVLEPEEKRIYVDQSQDYTAALETLYMAYLENDITAFPISRPYAEGLYSLLEQPDLSPKAVKGHVAGPVTWAATVLNENKQAVLWDETLSDAVAKLLRLKAAWMEQEMRKISPRTIILLDEPYMQSYGSSSFVALSREKVITLIEETLGGISGLKGIHCCGNTDWPVLLETSIDILSFDTYNYGESLTLYPDKVCEYLAVKKGAIAWGIIPNEEETVAKESVASLKDRLEEAIAPFTRNGLRFSQILEQSLLTPSCGLAGMKNGEALEQVFRLLTELSGYMRQKYL